ncbi:WD repeat-containing protein 86-like [Mizuhopecten yessoensis]|uniref:WD repeat-containing protein 86 n=1 Tax=Mizuhopecten yessoensis TaxID=6573 RepID=A0A210Q5Y1_MIZYE|nr:WD repeat-containing protein 86-like [Mizuhopecten yessoensis]OWF44147.1 WD repeat-containing protein 86 [Mizuhopecten yessoensis]
MGSDNSKAVKQNSETPATSRLLVPYPVFTYDEKHHQRINCLSFSPNKDFLVSGGEDGTVRIWELTTRKCVDVLKGHESYITCIIALEEFVVTGSGDKSIRKWNFNNGELLGTFEGHHGMISNLDIYENFLFSTSFDKTARIYNFSTGECLFSLEGHTKLISSMIVMPQRELLLTGSGDGTVRTWNCTSGETALTFSGHTGPILCVKVDVDKRHLYTGGDDKIVRQWDLDTAAPKTRFIGHFSAVLCLCLHRTKNMFFSGSSDRSIRRWPTQGKKGRMSSGNLRNGSIGTIIMPDGYNDEFIFAGTATGSIMCIDIFSMSPTRLYQPQLKSVPRFLILNGLMYTGTYGGEVNAWKADIATITGGRE